MYEEALGSTDLHLIAAADVTIGEAVMATGLDR